jgi:hypothetical protein
MYQKPCHKPKAPELVLWSVTDAFRVKVVPGNKLGPRWPSDHCGNSHQNGRPHSHSEALPEGKLNKSGGHTHRPDKTTLLRLFD